VAKLKKIKTTFIIIEVNYNVLWFAEISEPSLSAKIRQAKISKHLQELKFGKLNHQTLFATPKDGSLILA